MSAQVLHTCSMGRALIRALAFRADRLVAQAQQLLVGSLGV